MDQQQHEMILEKTHLSGAEEWYCPSCGRRILRRLPPQNNRVVVEPGNEDVYHVGGKGGLKIGSVKVTKQNEKWDETLDESLRPWRDAIDGLDLDW